MTRKNASSPLISYVRKNIIFNGKKPKFIQTARRNEHKCICMAKLLIFGSDVKTVADKCLVEHECSSQIHSQNALIRTKIESSA